MCDSLKNVCDEYHIYIFAYDDISYNYLQLKGLENVTVISLHELEEYFPELLQVKSDRSLAEYCWTTTSYTILYCLENFHVNHCTYIDADIYFFSNPIVLLDEIRDGDVLITEHRYTPQYDQSSTSGRYCVQFMTFKRNENGLYVLKWWKDQCFKWCYNRYENGKFGDQKYLDDWTDRFNNIVVLKHLGGGVAPWNVQQYYVSRIKNKTLGVQKVSNSTFEIIFFHFHYFRYFKIFNLYEYIIGPYFLDCKVIKHIYRPYIKKVSEIHKQLLRDKVKDENIGYEKMTLSGYRIVPHLIKSFFKRNRMISFM